MASEKLPFAGLGIGRWLRNATSGLHVADNNTFDALAAGMAPENYRRLMELKQSATELCNRLEKIQTQLHNHPHTEDIERLLDEYLQISLQTATTSDRKRQQKLKSLAIEKQLDTYPDAGTIIGLVAQEMELEPDLYTLYQQAEHIMGDRMTPDWPFQPDTKHKKGKRKKK